MFDFTHKLIIITGHFGSGKTNVAVNLALKLRERKNKTSLTDLDIVNPYFRAADSVKELEAAGVRCIIPEYANSNVDMPALPPDIYSVFNDDGFAVLDVGGDETGAAALGGYRHLIYDKGYEMYCVCNMYRPLTSNAADTVEIMREIEERSGLKCTGIINNSNIGIDTAAEDITDSFEYIDEVCRITGLPLICHCAVKEAELPDSGNIFYINNITKNIYGG